MYSAIIRVLAVCALVLSPPARPKPNPSFSPDDVVRIQLQALRENNAAQGDSGIALVFDFASPSNKKSTGPLERFVTVVRAPAYQPMLNHRRAERGPVLFNGNEARQRVTLTAADGETASYVFLLSKQPDGPYKDCWMTDGVVRDDDGPDAVGKPA